MTATPRKRIPRAEREQRMLDAAREVFGVYGFRDVPMDEIAQKSGITKALLYHYFASKQGLYEAVVERERERLFSRLAKAIASIPAPAARLEAYIAGYFDYIEENRGSWWLIYGETDALTVNEMRERNAQTIATTLAEGLEDMGRRYDPKILDELAHYLTGAGEQVGRWWSEHPEVPKRVVVQRFLLLSGAGILALTHPADDQPTQVDDMLRQAGDELLTNPRDDRQ